MKTSIIVNYSFDKVLKKITFGDFTSIALERILSITDMTNGVQIFSYRTPQYVAASVEGNVLTLLYDTNNDRFNNSDKLYIEYITDNYATVISTLLARTSTNNTNTITNYDAKGAIFLINTTAVSGEGATMVAKIQIQDILSGVWVDMPGASTINITSTGQTILTVYPGLTPSSNTKIDSPLPRIYRVFYTITGTTPSFTYSTSVQYIN